MKAYQIPTKNGKNQLTNVSGDNVTVGDMEVWALKFNSVFESEYSMQWLDEKYVTPAELLRREQREKWEAEHVKEGRESDGGNQLRAAAAAAAAAAA
jgi:hypothetical protein